MRPPSLSCTWCSGTSWSSVAEYSLTGTLTSPKLSGPFQIDRMAPVNTSAVHVRPLTRLRDAQRAVMRGHGGRRDSSCESAGTACAHQPRQGALPRDRHDQGRGPRLLLARRRRPDPARADRPAPASAGSKGVGTAEQPGEMFFEKNLEPGAPDWIAAPRDRALATTRTTTRSSTTSRRWSGSRRSPRSRSTCRSGGSADGGRGEPRPPGARPRPRRGRGLRSAPRSPAGAATSSTAWGSTRCRSRAGARASTSMRRSTAADQRRVSAVAHELARALEADHPDLVVSDMKKALRGGKVLLDWSQNNGSEDHDRAVLAARPRAPDGRGAAHLGRARRSRPRTARLRRGARARRSGSATRSPTSDSTPAGARADDGPLARLHRQARRRARPPSRCRPMRWRRPRHPANAHAS